MSDASKEGYEDYMRLLSSRLEAEKFEVHSPFEVGGLKVDFFAFRAFLLLEKRRIACFVSYDENPTLDRVQTYSQTAYKAGIDYYAAWQVRYMAFPIVASLAFDGSVISWVKGFQGKHFSKWNLTDDIEHPVLLDLSKLKIYHNTDKPIWQGLGVRMATNFASKNLVPSSS